MKTNFVVELAKLSDLERIAELYKIARQFMIKHNNPNQWQKNYPEKSLIEQDVHDGNLYVIKNNGSICAVFYFSTAPDPTYATIYNGCWISNNPYGVIHRIASDGAQKGILKTAVAFAFCKSDSIRIDTHQDNFVMQSALSALGFTKTGVILLSNGESRIAFQKDKTI